MSSSITTSDTTFDEEDKDSSFYPEAESEESDDECAARNIEITTKVDFVMRDILRKPKYYLGIPKCEMHIIDLIESETKISQRNIFIVLRKIRRNEELETLGDLFDMTKQNISLIFSTNVVNIAECLKDLIYWPDKLIISTNLPLAFKNRFKYVQSTIDCFELKIEKPSDPILQATSWSSYKQSNTFKYLISCTPDCLINFVSIGYGGRIADHKILKPSGYVQKLPRNCTVLADRGFKYAKEMLKVEKNCTLTRPPSVRANERSSKQDVQESKQISCVRIHIERAIGRVREFKILSPGYILDRNYFYAIDSIVQIACALANLQGEMIVKA